MSSRITTPSRRVAAIGAVFALIVALVATGIAVGENMNDDGGGSGAAASSDASAGAGKQGGAAEADPEQQKMYDQLDKATARREDGDALALGKKDAPVVLVEYADYQCSYCGRFTRETQPELVKKYVDDGTLRIEFRNFPIFGKDSERAARASWAAGRQGKFWAFHDELYAKLRKGDALAEDKLVDLARKSGVGDVDRFREDLKGSAATAAVKKDQNEGFSLGVQSTPSFVVGGRPIAGAQPMSAFEEAIDAARDHAKAGSK
ncbi:DsbA family protein [Streptomyces varsoviensis]|uniref:DSBA oxidoreductase n=1 Tax=Streptomyces varsoviensis TaxID=67373 RepID=A0ABR5IUW5_9ACTN|nr:DsbA family protein [Streptomyces varsoviensis]KOG73342.1 DSBA oxidoreductase [Streptomyces varsoviensis]